MPRTQKPLLGRGDQAQRWRAALGVWLAELRRARGLTQENLAAAVGASHANIISQIENGRAMVGPDLYRPLSEALHVPGRTFIRVLLRCQDATAYGMLWGFDDQIETEIRRAQRPPRVFGSKGKGGSRRGSKVVKSGRPPQRMNSSSEGQLNQS